MNTEDSYDARRRQNKNIKEQNIFLLEMNWFSIRVKF